MGAIAIYGLGYTIWFFGMWIISMITVGYLIRKTFRLIYNK